MYSLIANTRLTHMSNSVIKRAEFIRIVLYWGVAVCQLQKVRERIFHSTYEFDTSQSHGHIKTCIAKVKFEKLLTYIMPVLSVSH